MYKIQTLNKIAACGLDRLPRDNYESATEIVNPDGILLRSADMHSMEIPASVKAIARAGAGLDLVGIYAAGPISRGFASSGGAFGFAAISRLRVLRVHPLLSELVDVPLRLHPLLVGAERLELAGRET